MVHTTKGKSGTDLLSWAFVLSAALFMLVSIPASYQMSELVHSTELAAALVMVLEVMAFGAKLGTRWVPSWERQLDTITKVLLGITTFANFGAGWDYLWAHDLQGFWAGVRTFEVGGFYFGAFAIVAVLSALVPFGIYIFLTLFVKRQRELETIHTPETAAERALQPVILELRKQQRFMEELQGVAGLLPVTVGYSRVSEEPKFERTEAPVGEDWLASYQPPVDLTILSGAELLALPDSPEKDAEMSSRLDKNIGRMVDKAASWLSEQGYIEKATVCDNCSAQLTNAQKGVAVKWANRRGLSKVLCNNCRNSSA